MTTHTLDDYLNRLQGVVKSGEGYKALCPVHDDHNPSLSIDAGKNGYPVLFCHAGCSYKAIIAAMGMDRPNPQQQAKQSTKQKVVATYDYTDENGVLLRQKVRYEPKDFAIRCPDGNGGWIWKKGDGWPVLYRLPELLRAKAEGKTIFFPEGEKDVDTLVTKGLPASTNIEGASKDTQRQKWLKAYNQQLAGAQQLVLLPDADPQGRARVQHIARELAGSIPDIRIVPMPDGFKDVTDWLNAGHTVEELLQLVEATEPYHRPADTESPGPASSSKSSESSEPGYVDFEPLPLRRDPPPPAPFPLDALGSVLAPAAKRLMAVIQAPDSICGQSLLAAAALAVQPHANLIIDGRVKPLSLFCLTVAESGERKTAVDDEALSEHNELQKKRAESYQRDMEDYEIALVAWKQCREEAKKTGSSKRKKSIKDKVIPIGDWVPDSGAIKAALEKVGSAPTPPLLPVFKASEPTYEGIYKLLAEGYPAIGIFSDEGGRFIGGYAMNSENALKTAAGLSSLWDGKPMDRVRGGDGSSILYGRRVSLHLMMQPVVAESMFGNRTLRDQGFLWRCLPSWPTSTAGTRFYKAVDLSSDPDMQSYRQKIKEILEAPLPLRETERGHSRNELTLRNLPLADDAKALWVLFHDAIETELKDGGKLAAIRGFAAKAAEHAARIAGVLALVDDLNATDISQKCIEQGITLVDFYLTEVMRIHDTHAIDPDIPLAEKLLTWAQQHDFIHLRQIYQYGPNAIRDSETAKRIVGILESHGWVARVEGRELDGAYRKNVWAVWRRS